MDIGNWSRWLTDLFGMDDDDPLEDGNDHNDDDDDDERQDTSFKSFHILNVLSDLVMLPKDMVLSRSIRKKVCPTFGAPLIKRVLHSFVPDGFCPDPVPQRLCSKPWSILKEFYTDLFYAEKSWLLRKVMNNSLETGDEVVTSVPCTAAPIVYSPPSAASLAGIIGEIRSPQLRRSGSTVLRKSYTSDDELDELDSPLT
ncbi:hypothetical protein L1049_023281 [Liquidambar formosana]|uniref:Uncharacterized protein n=1 Tax=Liquidambar formosana TaxID=63359 RepID=A0AAP0RU65_LIQFO